MVALRNVEEERGYRETAAFAWEELAAAVRRLVVAIRAGIGL